MVINGKFYPWYPHIEQKDIGSNTSNKFIDTLSMANPYCVLMGADYDGDQITLKMAYSIESNEELKRYMESKAQFITLSGSNGRVGDKLSYQWNPDIGEFISTTASFSTDKPKKKVVEKEDVF